MKASKFSDAQKVFVLKQGDDGVPLVGICRKAGISEADVLQLERRIRRSAAGRDPAAESAGKRER